MQSEQSANQKRQGHSDAKLATVFVPEPDIEPGRCANEQWNGHERIDQRQKRQRLLDNKTQMHIPPARTRDSITIGTSQKEMLSNQVMLWTNI